MYICIALITNNLVQNKSRQIVYDLSQKYGISTIPSRLPQHISLKQSFKVDNIVEVEEYFNSLIKNLKPFKIQLPKVDLCLIKNEKVNKQILWFDVDENTELRSLHDKLNRDLEEKFGIKKQGYDGENFKFHSTIAYEVNLESTFKSYFESIKDKEISTSFIADEIALFYSPDDELIGDNFITYKIRSLY